MSLAEFFSQIRWRPQIGDPSVMGWLTVAAYGAAAVLCLFAAFRRAGQGGDGTNRAPRRLWLAVGLLMVFLAINKQFDLQSLMTDIGRVLATREGWYGQRRIVQRWFVSAVAVAGVLLLVLAVKKLGAALRHNLVLLVGLVFLVSFIVVRAASFHHVDVLIRSEVLGVRVNWVLELGGICLIGYGAARSIRRPRPG